MENLKLLIIEDDVDQRDLIRETLEDYFGQGCVVGVGTTKAALEQDLASFNLILSDYNLPDGSGMQLLEKIKEQCSTPFIMVTGENVAHIAAEAIRKGATDYVVKLGDFIFTIPLIVEKNLTVANIKRENESLRQELERALRAVRDKNAQLEKSLKRVEELAATDPLTGLYNRRHFSKLLEQLFSESQRYEKDLACVMIDLDEYKEINDSFGHQVGDQILMLAGKVITSNLRKMDVAARYGGDEFVLLLPHARQDEALGVVQRIREEFMQGSAVLLRRNKGVTMSVGIGTLGGNTPGYADQLLTLADAALYRAKDSGRNQIMFPEACATGDGPHHSKPIRH